jgi:hypothetical protein
MRKNKKLKKKGKMQKQRIKEYNSKLTEGQSKR